MQPLWLGSLAEPTALKLVVEASVRATSAALPPHLDAAKRARAAEMAAYSARLRAGRVALRALARALIAAGPQAALALLQPSAAAAAAVARAPGPSSSPPAADAAVPADGMAGEQADDVDAALAGGDVQLWAARSSDGGGGGDGSGWGGNQAGGLAVLLAQLEGLLCGFVGQWSALKAHEQRVAAEEAEMFKTKVRSTTMLTEEVGTLWVSKC